MNDYAYQIGEILAGLFRANPRLTSFCLGGALGICIVTGYGIVLYIKTRRK